MPRHCSAGGCKSRDNRESRRAGITFHKLPKGATRRNLWITNSQRADSWDPQSDFVYFCSQHFTPESFELTGYSGIRRLREDAFPTLFNLPATTKPKRAGRLQKRGDAPVRKSLRSCDQEKTQEKREKDNSHPPEELTGQRSAAAPEETHENTPAPSQEPSELSPEEKSPPPEPEPEPEPRPISPSRYMRRLPPPPGFYLPKEHSYAQLCPLLWRRRYDQAIDCLEKALRQLHAARRRENRLRSTVHRLQDKRLKQALQVSREVFKDRRSLSPGAERRQGRGDCNLQDSENDRCEDSGEFEDRGLDQMESEGPSSWSEEERGRCFYCGQRQGQDKSDVSKTGERRPPTAHEVSHRNSANSPRGTADKVKEVEKSKSRSPPEKGLETHSSGKKSSVLLQTQNQQHVAPAGLSLLDVHEQFLGSQQKFVLTEGDTESVGQQQQLFWLQDCAEGPVVLVPVPAEDGLQNLLKKEGVADGTQTILVSEVDLKGEFGPLTESGGGVCSDAEVSEQQSVLNMREKLKEHLEGFHLQLSSEFLT
ncbi:THAP domain-containing protein 7 [Notolabrus celidotus]|uniref:THAP domain-containing protein 7 n=1 Tax=Notolabrus celidotus TaxID=1203425 RepID=UPI00148F6CC4|nr:THAP domain-containing protein 7 [Notolabrus celidotus]